MECAAALLEVVQSLTDEVRALRHPKPTVIDCPAGTLPIYPLGLCPEGVQVLFLYSDNLFQEGHRAGDKVYGAQGLMEFDLDDFDAWTPMPLVDVKESS